MKGQYFNRNTNYHPKIQITFRHNLNYNRTYKILIIKKDRKS